MRNLTIAPLLASEIEGRASRLLLSQLPRGGPAQRSFSDLEYACRARGRGPRSVHGHRAVRAAGADDRRSARSLRTGVDLLRPGRAAHYLTEDVLYSPLSGELVRGRE